ncbi:RND family efflux transporter MFP subunit [Rhizobium cellulosilyticum]|uniref:RND family efflux transporter MFP subunit n=2 Tax=Aliirhizobium cellulosilyticum TaxID=393664 RepID=A0A7W6SDG4_9HYPH|nr:efflux RND transporter periplasmic adaptor subunit [Rhizobium cellulosilyticum]MBB4351729.1 RND family efflux transporter MFP subunit [Rhizobium cellulosilyticum]MBB4415015.1 RND family efflux transporter MFP subunit [Rhizobium cellulosilyticum]MBB4449655.1 RND family efflux transporter MFP subunit [Rhizobium cellulosilyticum]
MVVSPKPVSHLQITGTIEPRTHTELGFRILGRISVRNVDTGDLVRKGDVIASLDPLALELAVRSAQSDLSNATVQLDNAITTEARQRMLAQSRSGTEAALEEAEQARRSAEAAVAKARANLDKAEEQLGYAQLRAEFDGVVTETSAEAGQVVSAGQSVVTVARPDERDAVVDIPQSAASHLQNGDRFEVFLQIDAKVATTGIVREIAPAADSATRTSRTKIALSDPPAAFRLGSVVTVSAAMDLQSDIQVPTSALIEKDGQKAVWVVDPASKTVALRKVAASAGNTQAGTTAIENGIEAGERIVVAGVHKLTDGQSIRFDGEATQ